MGTKKAWHGTAQHGTARNIWKKGREIEKRERKRETEKIRDRERERQKERDRERNKRLVFPFTYTHVDIRAYIIYIYTNMYIGIPIYYIITYFKPIRIFSRFSVFLSKLL